MRASRFVAGAFALALVSSFTPVLHAASPVEIDEAKALLREGERAFKAGEYDKARVKFSAAYGVIPSVDILWNVATSEFKAGRVVESLKHFRQYVRDPNARPERKKEAESDYIPAALKQAGHVEVVAPEGAVIVVDGGATSGNTPLVDGIDLAPGVHKIAARLGDKTDAQDVSAAPGQSITVKFFGAGAGGGLATGRGASNATGSAGASGSGASPDAAASSGQNALGPHVDPPAEPEHGTHWGAAKIVTVAGLGVAALASGGGAIAMFSNASSKDDEAGRIRAANPAGCANPTTPQCRQLQSTLDDRDSAKTLGGVFVGGAIVLGAGAIVAAIFFPNTRDTRVGATGHGATSASASTADNASGWLLPWMSATSGGVSFGNRF